jgi:transposase-like protein
VNTTASESSKPRRSRRKHTAEFKAQAVAACRHAGVSIAAIAMANGVNANLLRRWVIDADHLPDARPASNVTTAASAPSFLSVPLSAAVATPDIRIELRRGTTSISVTWPTSAAADCAAWMRELLR